MLEPSQRAADAAPGRFDGASARSILERAAEEQQRLDNALADSYSMEELQEMAAELRISPGALQRAITAHQRERTSAGDGAGTRGAAPGHARGRAALDRWTPTGWSPGFRNAVVAGSGFVALTAALLSLWALAPTIFWVTLLSLAAVSLLVLLGGAPG